MKRLFVAVKITPDETFIQTYSLFRQKMVFSRIAWVEPDVMHLTLKFLGDTPADKIPFIGQVLAEASQGLPPLDFQLDHLGIFGSSYDPRVIWVGSSDSAKLSELGHAIIDGLHQAGFHRDRQNFVPHLSLGRIKKVENKKYFQMIIDEFRNRLYIKGKIEEVLLFNSILTSSGPIYQKISAFKLI